MVVSLCCLAFYRGFDSLMVLDLYRKDRYAFRTGVDGLADQHIVHPRLISRRGVHSLLCRRICALRYRDRQDSRTGQKLVLVTRKIKPLSPQSYILRSRFSF